jgi:molybdate transport system ATP-binding protein
VLRDIDLTLREGKHCAFIGPNGSGKSTLLRLLRGELWPARGSVFWHTADGAETSPLAGRSMSALVSPALQENYQRQAWDISGRDMLLTAGDDSPLLYSAPDAVWSVRAEAVAKRLSADALLDRSIATLSQGQLRLLLLARGLLRAPRLLLLDECANGLDAGMRARFFDLLAEYMDFCTVVMTSHRPGLIPDWCAERHYIKDGRLVSARCIRSCASVPRHAPAKDKDGSLPRPGRPKADAVAGDMLLNLKNVTVFVERNEVLHNIDWTVHRGEHWRISGANGSGKSTLLRLLAGDEFAAAGGEITRCLPRRGVVRTMEQWRRGARLVSDLSQALYGYELSGFELVCSGFDNTIGIYRDFSTEEQKRVRAILAQLHASDLANASIRRLSSGQLRLLFLARALVGEPEILLLDEPCSGLDAESRRRYLNLLDNLAESGIHLVFVSHFDEDAPLCINRWARMENGYMLSP